MKDKKKSSDTIKNIRNFNWNTQYPEWLFGYTARRAVWEDTDMEKTGRKVLEVYEAHPESAECMDELLEALCGKKLDGLYRKMAEYVYDFTSGVTDEKFNQEEIGIRMEILPDGQKRFTKYKFCYPESTRQESDMLYHELLDFYGASAMTPYWEAFYRDLLCTLTEKHGTEDTRRRMQEQGFIPDTDIVFNKP